MYHQQNEHHDFRQQPQPQPGAQTQFFPGFPGIPGIPGIPGGDLHQRVRRLEEQQFRTDAEIDRLQRQVNQLERRVRNLEGGGYYPWGQREE
jgi:hypothetical protein